MDNSKGSAHLGLLLPLTGPLARAGEAVRDGFIAASLLAGAGGSMRLSIYDTAAEPAPAIYERLLADNVTLIIGPLQKESATTLNSLNPEIPVLLLNYLDAQSPPAPAVSQLGLAIEDEAVTIARRLKTDKVSSALLFHNYEDWSLRARKTLMEEAGHSNAVHQTDASQSDLTLTVQPFTDMRTITEAVGSAMHVAASRERKDELASLLGEQLEFLPRARGDVDAVIALVDNVEANALVPALRFHFADHLPVYASSQVTRRTRNSQLGELGGFHVSELPWFLDGDPAYAAMRRPFNLDSNPFASLVALGSDAFRIAERLQPENPSHSWIMLGSTGLLRLQPDGRISRELAWGRIADAGVHADTGAAR
jgi:hypothetical protein